MKTALQKLIPFRGRQVTIASAIATLREEGMSDPAIARRLQVCIKPVESKEDFKARIATKMGPRPEKPNRLLVRTPTDHGYVFALPLLALLVALARLLARLRSARRRNTRHNLAGSD